MACDPINRSTRQATEYKPNFPVKVQILPGATFRDKGKTMKKQQDISAEELAEIDAWVEEELKKPSPFYDSLAHCKVNNGWVVVEGDWGGTIYFTVPARLVKCSNQSLLEIAAKVDLSPQGWDCNEGDGLQISFQSGVVGGSVSGGMGGGILADTLWVHESIESWRKRIEEVLFA